MLFFLLQQFDIHYKAWYLSLLLMFHLSHCSSLVIFLILNRHFQGVIPSIPTSLLRTENPILLFHPLVLMIFLLDWEIIAINPMQHLKIPFGQVVFIFLNKKKEWVSSNWGQSRYEDHMKASLPSIKFYFEKIYNYRNLN